MPTQEKQEPLPLRSDATSTANMEHKYESAAAPAADHRPMERFASAGPEDRDFRVQVFEGEWDAEGVFFYQAFNDQIATWALAHQRFGGPDFKSGRMSWIKPSFGWMLYRSGYGCKPNQTTILKIKVPHVAVAEILSHCQCAHMLSSEEEGVSNGKVQWDPARDMMSGEGREPRRMLRRRAIQIGIRGRVSEIYNDSILSIQDVTALARSVGEAHSIKVKNAKDGRAKGAMAALLPALPVERPYMPACAPATLVRLGMLAGPAAETLERLGRGKACDVRKS